MLIIPALIFAVLWWSSLVLLPWLWAQRRGDDLPAIARIALWLSVGAVAVAAVASPRDVVVAGLLPVPTAAIWLSILADDRRPTSESLYPLAGDRAPPCSAGPVNFSPFVTQEQVKSTVADMIRQSARENGTVDWDCLVWRFNASGEKAWVRYIPAAGESKEYDTLLFTLDARSAWSGYTAVPGGHSGLHTAVVLRTAAGDVGMINWRGDQRTTVILGSPSPWEDKSGRP